MVFRPSATREREGLCRVYYYSTLDLFSNSHVRGQLRVLFNKVELYPEKDTQATKKIYIDSRTEYNWISL
jgi:hypothetical protein